MAWRHGGMGAWRHGGMEAWGDGGLEKYLCTTGYNFFFSGLIIKNMADFRFQDLDIWKDSKDLSKGLFIMANALKRDKYHSFSDQLFRATLSITNNIAEGSGSTSNKDFGNFLMIARKSIIECANIIIILHDIGLIDNYEKDRNLKSLKELSKKIYFFRKTLLSDQ